MLVEKMTTCSSGLILLSGSKACEISNIYITICSSDFIYRAIDVNTLEIWLHEYKWQVFDAVIKLLAAKSISIDQISKRNNNQQIHWNRFNV